MNIWVKPPQSKTASIWFKTDENLGESLPNQKPPQSDSRLMKIWVKPPQSKTASIWFKTDENLDQVRLLLFPASKKAPPPPLRIPGDAPDDY